MTVPMLSVGDKVLWRGAWGNEAAKVATVTHIDWCEPGEKHGVPVTTAPWWAVAANIVVTLDNGHLAYGRHLAPLSFAEAPYWRVALWPVEEVT